MSKIEERELFFEHIKKIYMQNPDFEVTPDTIYYELSLFNVQDGKKMRISNDNLINIQAQLSNDFRKKDKIKCFSNGYFFAIENRGSYDDKTFYDKMNTSIKLYIACDIKNLYNVTSLVFNYMIDENIITQSKIAKEMRNDVLVVRVSTMEEAEKVSEFVNSLDYNSLISYNPYILSNGKVGMTYDGTLSYNKTLSLLMNSYFNTKKNSNSLDKSTMEDFVNFIKREVLLCINDSKYFERAEIIREKGTNRSAFFRGEVNKYGWVEIGSSFLPSEIISAFLYGQLEHLDEIQTKRTAIWNRYYTKESNPEDN